MEFPRVVHDELLHKLDEPRAQHLLDTIHLAQAKEKQRRTANKGGTSAERTPLLASSEVKSAVVLDVRTIDAILDVEEEAAIHADAMLTTWEILRVELKQLAHLSVPLMLAGLVDVLPDVVLNIMAGHISAKQSTHVLAALSFCSIFQALLIDGITNGVSSGMDTLCSQAYGAKKFTELWLFCQAGIIVYMICFPILTAILIGSGSILQALGQDEIISQMAGSLLLMYIFSLPLEFAYATMKSSLQTQNIVIPFFVASSLGWVAGNTIGYYLAFHTSIGYLGFAIANPVNWIVKFSILLPIVLRNKLFLESWPGWQFTQAKELVPKVAKLGGSSFLMLSFQFLGFVSITLLAGLLPHADITISANGIFAWLLAFSFVPLVGFSIAGAIRIGNSLGSGQARRAKLVATMTLIGSVSVAMTAMILNALVASSFAGIFTPNEEAAHTATELIKKLLCLIPLFGVVLGVQGIFRACGKQLLCAKLNFLCLFVLAIPLGLYFAIKLDAGLPGLWYAHAIGLCLFGVISFLWLARTSWRQLAHEAKHNLRLDVE